MTLLAAALLLVAACQDAPPPAESDIVGTWCGVNGEILTFNSDDSFTIEHLSERYANDVLHLNGYIDGYRLRTEFGGVAPPTAAGKWRLIIRGNDLLDSHDHSIELTFSALGDRAVDESHELFFEYDEEGQIVLVVQRHDFYRMFDKCPSPTPSR